MAHLARRSVLRGSLALAAARTYAFRRRMTAGPTMGGVEG